MKPSSFPVVTVLAGSALLSIGIGLLLGFAAALISLGIVVAIVGLVQAVAKVLMGD